MCVIGIFFKAGSWTISFLFLSKGAGKLFFMNELVTHTYTLVLNILGYYHFGLMGLGLSFLVAYFLYFIQVYIVAKIKYEFVAMCIANSYPPSGNAKTK